MPISTSTTTKMSTSTTTSSNDNPITFPKKVLGMYILLADDTEDGFHTDADWEPQLFKYQQEGANVLFFTFINPDTMEVPLSFDKLASTRGTNVDGAVPKDTVILFAIGGYQYSVMYNPWSWLTSQQAAESMAEKVATWPDLYNCDGIDLDIEAGAGSNNQAGPNLVHFIRRLKELKPNMIIGQPTYGYPQVQAEIDVINESWNVDSTSNNIADSVGLMVYEGTQALNYVKNFVNGADQWEGFPIKVNVKSTAVMLGCKGSSGPGSISTLAHESVKQDLLGIMVWYASVQNGLQYEHSWDSTESEASQQAYIEAMTYFNDNMYQ